MARPPAFAIAALLGALLTACSTGAPGGSAMPLTGNDGVQTVSDAADALVARRTATQNARDGAQAVNALGLRLMDFNLIGLVGEAAVHPNGRTCRDGIELFSPDRNGDPQSGEAMIFYDLRCRQLAVDAVRKYAMTSGSSQNSTTTSTYYLPNNANAVATRIESATIVNASFDRFGLPRINDGFAATRTSQLTVGSSTYLTSGSELVLNPWRRGTTFCTDSSGFSPTSIPSLDMSGGWQGGTMTGGSISNKGDGFITLSATPTGTVFVGSSSSFSIHQGTQNTSCPISTPAFTLSGGSAAGTYSLPIDVTLHRGTLWSVTVKNGLLPNGDTINVRTYKSHRHSNRPMISGNISSGSTSIATFMVNMLGNGKLTITASGAVYTIVGWTVVG